MCGRAVHNLLFLSDMRHIRASILQKYLMCTQLWDSGLQLQCNRPQQAIAFSANGSRKFVLLSQLEEGHFVDRGGEFQLELSLSTARSVYEHRGAARRHFQYWSANLHCDGSQGGSNTFGTEFCSENWPEDQIVNLKGKLLK